MNIQYLFNQNWYISLLKEKEVERLHMSSGERGRRESELHSEKPASSVRTGQSGSSKNAPESQEAH